MRRTIIYLLLFALVQIGCKKANDWLNAPRTKQDVTFSKLQDYQTLLNNTSIFNNSIPGLGLVGSDNFYVKESSIQNMPVVERNSYLWNKDIFEGRASIDYTSAYQAINYANVVLDGIENVKKSDNEAQLYFSVKGQALFYRAFMYFELASLFCKPFSFETARSDKGLCLRRYPDINEIVKRSSVWDTYAFILNDLKASAYYLDQNNKFKTQPTKVATFLMLSRVYLNMFDFENAKLYADSTLALTSSLIDFSKVPNISLPYRFPDFKGNNPEIIFYAQSFPYSTVLPNNNVNQALVDTFLFRSYEIDDLRRLYFYSEIDSITVKFKGSYTGAASIFSGLSINEAFFIRAECNARRGQLSEATRDLNHVLSTRYKAGRYTIYESNNQDSVLAKIICERRKEFPFSGSLRWQDLRRYNLDPRLATSIFRKFAGSIRELKPNDPKYVYPFPQSEINLAGIEQNER